MSTSRALTREKILEIAGALPPGPRVFAGLERRLRNPNSRLDEIAELLKVDATLTAHILRVSNSVALGAEQRTASVEEAVTRIGYAEVFRLVGYVTGTQLAERSLKHYGVEADQLREHMVHTAFMCEELAGDCGVDPRLAYTAGLMRPLGLLVIDRVADFYQPIESYHPINDRDYLMWEGRLFGISSCDVAALVLNEWSFPAELVEAVRDHYLLSTETPAAPLTRVLNLAGSVVADEGHALLGEARHWSLAPQRLEALGLTTKRVRAAATRAREAFDGFQQRLERSERREAADQPSAWAPTAAPALAVVVRVPPGASVTSHSCNSGATGGVVEETKDAPVRTADAGANPPDEFTTFMRSYQDMVYSTAIRLLGNEAQAEDVSQEVFLKAYERWDNLRASPTVGGWLKTVATNLSLNHLQRYRKRWRFFSEFRAADAGTEEDLPEIEFAAPEQFFVGVDRVERRAWVERALDQLPEHQRVPLVLFHFEDRPYEEIARLLGVSLAKVKTDILRARAALAQILTRSGTPHEPFKA